jgi:hypothetical protein
MPVGLIASRSWVRYLASKENPAVFVLHTYHGVVMLHTHADDYAATGPPNSLKNDYAALLRPFRGREVGGDRQSSVSRSPT